MVSVNTLNASINASYELKGNNSMMETAIHRLSSGKRINSAADDAAGLSIANNMTSQIKGLKSATKNAGDGISLVNTIEGALTEVTDMLQRMRELAVQSTSDTNNALDRMFIQDEVDALKAEINRVARTTVFNDQFILDGSYADRTMQIGAEEGQIINFGVDDTSSDSLGSFSILFRPNATSAQNAYSNTAGHQLRGQNSAAAASYAAATTALSALVNAAADYTISGQFGTLTAYVDGGASSKEAAFAFNQISAETGVTATAVTKAQMHTLATAGTLTFDLFGKNDVGLVATTGGTGVKVQATVSTTTDLTNLKDAINEHTGVTGVTASLSSDRSQINLVQDEGYDIVISDFLNSAGTGGTMQVANILVGNEGTEDRASNVTLGGATTTDSVGIMGQISLSSDRGFTVRSGNAANHFSATQTTHRAAQQTVSSINMLSKLGSAEAISVIDAAIQQVSDQRSEMGAINNRLESTIENLSNIIVNTEAAVSRIMDADYADETTKLSKSQVLTQAATAMLAQANQQPQGILRLLGAG